MTEKEEQERFRKGFNYGYLMARYEPELLKKILDQYTREEKFCGDSPYARGMNLGKDQYEFDMGWQKQAQHIDAAEKSGEISKEFIEKELEKDKTTQRQLEIEKLKQQAKTKGRDMER